MYRIQKRITISIIARWRHSLCLYLFFRTSYIHLLPLQDTVYFSPRRQEIRLCALSYFSRFSLFGNPKPLSGSRTFLPDTNYCTYQLLSQQVMKIYELSVLSISNINLLFSSLHSMHQASKPYFREENVLFLCCLMIAIAVESSNVHRRIALKIMSFPCVGTR